MVTDNGGHVAHTAVAGFYIVSIEQLVISVVLWEMLISLSTIRTMRSAHAHMT